MPLNKLVLSLIAVLLGIAAYSQTTEPTGPFTIPGIETHKIKSSIIGEDYTLYVLKTDGYDTSTKKLSVLYMTDGDWNMTVAMNCFSMLRQDYITHEPLVVGIGYGMNKNMRFRDLDPKTGGPNFLSFIEKEVMPFIDKTYRTNNERAIYGYSMGGMFTTHILFNRSDLFQKIFIGAPGNNGRELMPAAREYFKTHSDLKSKVFIGVGTFEKETSKNIDSFATFLRSKKLPDLELNAVNTPDAGHGAALAAVMQNAVAFGYCEKHTRVTGNPSSFKSLAGKYVFYEKDTAREEANILSKNGKLFLKWGSDSMESELVSSGANEFFLPENERLTFRFINKDLVIAVAGDKDYQFVKK